MRKLNGKLLLGTILLLIVIVGGVLRLYRHRDLLHFELDQARDAIIVSEAVEKGPGELPLLGPRAAGTMLRLGPFFYYQEYLSAKIFGNTPAGMNGIGVLVSIFTIPLVFIYLKCYFSRLVSILVTAVFSVSLFVVAYGRFAWNPNMLLFFVTGLLISLLVLGRRNGSKLWFVYFTAFLFGIAVQLHFLAFVVLPVLVVAYGIWIWIRSRFLKIKASSSVGQQDRKKKGGRLGWVHWALAGLLVLLLNGPTLINESLTGGDNTREFFQAFSEKTEEKEGQNLGEKFFRNVGEYAKGYFLIVAGNQGTDVLDVEFLKEGQLFDVKCDKLCRERLPMTVLALIFWGGGLILFGRELIILFKKDKGKERGKKLDFLVLNGLLLGITFFGFLPVAFKFPPRFLLMTLPVAFVFVGLWLKGLEDFIEFAARVIFRGRKSRKRAVKGVLKMGVLATMGIGLVFLNLYYNFERFREQEAAHTENPIYFERDLVLKEDLRFTLLQQELIMDWMMERSGQKTVFVWGPPKYYRPFVYHLNYQREKDGRRLRYSAPCLEADYFTVIRSTSESDFFEKGEAVFQSVESKQFGTLTVHKLAIKDAALAEAEKCSQKEEEKPAKYARRYTWKEIFGEK